MADEIKNMEIPEETSAIESREQSSEQLPSTNDVPVRKNDGRLRRDTFRQSMKTGEYQRRHAKRRKQKREEAKRKKEEEKNRGSGYKGDSKGKKESDHSDAGTEKDVENLKKDTGKKADQAAGKKKARKRTRWKEQPQSRRRVNRKSSAVDKPDTESLSGAHGIKDAESWIPTVATTAPLILNNAAHHEVSKYEEDNSAVQAVHSGVKTAETTSMYADYHTQKKKLADAKKAEKTAREAASAEEVKGMSAVLKHEQNKEKQQAALKKLQRNKMQREYAKALKEGQTAAEAGKTAAKSVSGGIAAVGERVKEVVSDHKGVLVSLGVLSVLVMIMINMLSSCGAMANGMLSTTMSASYLSKPDDLDAAEVYFTEKEMKLQTKIDNMESTHPGYDEYDYNIGVIGHNPFTLLNYLSAKYTEFTFDEVKPELDTIFDDMYHLTTASVTETRTREVELKDEEGNTVYDDEGNPVITTEEYTVRIFRVTLISASLDMLVAGSMNDEQKGIYEIYQESKGLLQQFASPVDYYWYLYVSSYYGYRKNPTTKAEEFHKGLDISIPSGSKVYSGQDGTVTQKGYDGVYGNYIVVNDDKGYTTKYAFLDTTMVSNGETVTAGQQIGTSGSTGSSIGSQLHIECLYNGTYYNPLLYFDAGEETLYGEEAKGTGGGFGPGGTIPPDAYDDPTVQRLMEEAVKYIGYPYVWGGSSPETSFDCSGYVSWVYNASGVHPMGRLTAQGIYDQCIVVPPSMAKPGDMVVFTGTYNSPGPVSHIGIYCGNNTMLHCGNPIGYATLSNYWQQHFYAFIRWP